MGINEYGCQYNDTNGCLGDTNYASLCIDPCNGSSITPSFESDITIKKGELLKIKEVKIFENDITINDGGILCIGKEGSLTIHGIIINRGIIVNNGILTINGTMQNNSLIVNNNTITNNNKDFVISSNGKIENNGMINNGDIVDIGRIDLIENAVINGNGSITNNKDNSSCICVDENSIITCRIFNPKDCDDC